MSEVILNIIAALLIIMAVANVYFLWHNYRLHHSVSPRSPLLFALFGVAVVVWTVGVYIAFIAVRVLLSLPALPFQGIGLGIAILILEFLPAFIWYQMRRFVTGDQDRDKVRDEARDTGRDYVRDPARDAARDAEHDVGP